MITAAANITTSVISLFILLSCNGNKEEEKLPVQAVLTPKAVNTDTLAAKLENKIKLYETADLQLGGYRLFGIETDSISYDSISLKDFYIARKKMMVKDRDRQKIIYAGLRARGQMPNTKKLEEDSLKSIRAFAEIDHWIEAADIKKSIYQVGFKMIASTSAANYNGWFTKYLFMKDLSEVRVQF